MDNGPIRVLLVDDDEDDYVLTRDLLAEIDKIRYGLDWVRTYDQALETIAHNQHDVYLLDYRLGHSNGLELLRRGLEQQQHRPMIMLTGQGDHEVDLEAMRLGAADYLVKSQLNAPLLERSLRYALERTQTLAALQQQNQNLGLLNDVSQVLTETLDPQQVTERLLVAASNIIGAEGSSVWLEDLERKGWLVCQAVAKQGERQLLANLRLRPGQGVVGWVFQHGKSSVVTRAADDPRHTSAVDRLVGSRTESLLAVPLKVRDKTTGVLELVNKVNGAFTEDDLSLVETLAASAAIAIENARLVEALRQQTDELQARNEDLDTFAHTVAHDLQAPLSLVIGFAQVLTQDDLGLSEGDRTNYLQAIAQNGQRMSNIINELLLLASVRKLDVVSSPLDMVAIVEEVQQRLAFTIKEQQARVFLPEEWPLALGYGPWVEEVWANYVSNAIKYGGRPPRIELGAITQDNGMVRFWVKDNGAGLSPADQARLFKPFTRLQQVRAKGHGLGLSIVLRIIEKLGGAVGVESEVGQGSTFYFTLPAA